MVGGAYHFKTVDGPASTAVVEAVSFVTGRDPLDLEPLGRVLDTAALDRLIETADRAAVAFEYEGLSVRVRARGDIYVDGQGALPLANADLRRSNVLLLEGPGTGATCSEHIDAVGGDEANVLAVTFSPDAGRLDSWLPSPGPASSAAVISVGDVARSSAEVASSPAGRAAPAIDTVDDPDDLVAVEEKIAEWLDAWEREGDAAIVCFDSVTTLLDRFGRSRTVGFLQAVTERTKAAAAGAHFHLDAESYEGDFAESASTLFDAVVTVREDGRWVVEPDVEE